MYVCVCAGVTDQQIMEAAKHELSADALATKLGVGQNCGNCLDYFYELASGQGCLPSVGVQTTEITFEPMRLSA